jgi:hypothetical protein
MPVTPDTCPNCGADVPSQAKACPACGSDEQTGWSEKARSDDLGLPDEEFDYQEFVQREFGGKVPSRKLHPLWWLVALLLTGLFVLYWFR